MWTCAALLVMGAGLVVCGVLLLAGLAAAMIVAGVLVGAGALLVDHDERPAGGQAD